MIKHPSGLANVGSQGQSSLLNHRLILNILIGYNFDYNSVLRTYYFLCLYLEFVLYYEAIRIFNYLLLILREWIFLGFHIFYEF